MITSSEITRLSASVACGMEALSCKVKDESFRSTVGQETLWIIGFKKKLVKNMSVNVMYVLEFKLGLLDYVEFKLGLNNYCILIIYFNFLKDVRTFFANFLGDPLLNTAII